MEKDEEKKYDRIWQKNEIKTGIKWKGIRVS